MPEKLLLSQDLDVPFIIGMVAQARAFVIDKAMITLIILLATASSTGGVAIYKLSMAEKAISTLADKVDTLTLSNNSLVAEVKYLRSEFDKHLLGHPVRIAH
ncbi:hypothetical protein KAR91_12540 [Candidatus Pacearchaeota archaeon]|nr:hypothetical protein [Candidatus Pacearchaeota archaeon]